MVSFCKYKEHHSFAQVSAVKLTPAPDDEIEIEDFTWDPVAKVFHTPCPCGDRFEISRGQLARGEDTATCPSCSLIVRVIYDMMDYEDCLEEEDDSEEEVTEENSVSISQAMGGLKI